MLGCGQDGLVWRTEHTAVKCFVDEIRYSRELACYQLLADDGVSRIGRFNVPRLIEHDKVLLIVEMDVVKPPYVLDFGKAYAKAHPLDRPHPYSDEEITRWREDAKAKYWEDHEWPIVQDLVYRLEDHGICYLDVSPGNVNLGDLANPP